MEKHLLSRPPKIPYPVEEQERLRGLAIRGIEALLLPSDDILKIILIGSSVKGSFGKYEAPGFRGSLFSDFDFIVFCSDSYVIPSTLSRELGGKPFPQDELNLAYRVKNFVEETFDAEVFFVRESSTRDETIKRFGEEAGIPMNDKSMHPFLVVYERERR